MFQSFSVIISFVTFELRIAAVDDVTTTWRTVPDLRHASSTFLVPDDGFAKNIRTLKKIQLQQQQQQHNNHNNRTTTTQQQNTPITPTLIPSSAGFSTEFSGSRGSNVTTAATWKTTSQPGARKRGEEKGEEGEGEKGTTQSEQKLMTDIDKQTDSSFVCYLPLITASKLPGTTKSASCNSRCSSANGRFSGCGFV